LYSNAAAPRAFLQEKGTGLAGRGRMPHAAAETAAQKKLRQPVRRME